MSLGIKKKGSSISVRTGSLLLLVVFVPVFIIWLTSWFTVEIGGTHIHHFLLGIAFQVVAIIELFIQKVTFRGKFLDYKITLVYTAMPLITFALGITLILTDGKDFATWVRTGVLLLN